MLHLIDFYSFPVSYTKDWEIFISQFPEETDDFSTQDIRDSCSRINQLIHRLYEEEPEYRTQMNIYFIWQDLLTDITGSKSIYAEKALDWFATQLRNMIVCDQKEIQDSVWYSLGVDYFECGPHGKYLFPRLYDSLPDSQIERLMMSSISIPWKDKATTYRNAIQRKEHHVFLAIALEHSCKAYCYHSAIASEALEILKQLTIPKEQYQKIYTLLTKPIQVKIRQVYKLQTPLQDGTTGFLSIVSDQEQIPTWFPFAALWINGQKVGVFQENYHQIQWEKLIKTHGFSKLKEQEYQEKILIVNIPFKEAWKGKTAELRPL
ncbi:MAG: hypothetical protein MUC49_01475 [Raineya sp.]|jgi:hypothetical protein|nr:hypothetical protein [Raineya sp.]